MATQTLTLDEIADLASRVLASNGLDEANTAALVRTIVAAERDMCLSHGLFRLPGYVASLRSGKINGAARPAIAHRTPVILGVDGANGFAPLTLELAIPPLAEAAKVFGIAIAAITHSHHFAALWPEVEAIAGHGLIGMACTNYMPAVAPAGAREAIFGTNPLAIAWPRPGKEPVVLDMATAAMARGEISIAAREGRDVPAGTGLDRNGTPTTDPAEILKGVILPFGGHKGSGLALMVELLSAGLTGEGFSFENGARDNNDGGPAQGGQILIAISPTAIAGPEWATHCEEFFARYDAIAGARLPGARRMRNRGTPGPREVDSALLERVRGLAR
jgi:delta1-piperideine-2-carboxylate reductase